MKCCISSGSALFVKEKKHLQTKEYPLEAVDGRAYYCLGVAIRKWDGVWEEGSLVDLGFCDRY